MSYLSDKAKERKRNIRFSIIGVLLLLIIIFWKSVQSITYPYVEPLIFLYSNTKSGIFYIPKNISLYFHSQSDYIKQIADLLDNIERLENEVALKDGKIADYQTKIEEKNEKGLVTLIAHPLMRDLASVYSTIILSRGFSDGVEEGMLVYIRGRQPVGFISKIHEKTSEMTLLSDSNNKLNGVINGDEVLPMIGFGGGNFISNIPKDTNIKVGDKVSYGPDPSMKIGEVVDIKNDEQDAFMKVYIKGYYNPVKANTFFLDK